MSNVAQAVALAALEVPQGAIREWRKILDACRLLAHYCPDDSPGFECPLSEGAFYLFPSLSGTLGHEVDGRRVSTSLELCEALLETTRVALVSGEAFGSSRHLRLSFAAGERELEEGLHRLSEALE